MHPLEILDLIGIAIPKLAMLILATATFTSVVACAAYLTCKDGLINAKSLWELRDLLSWSASLWPVFGSRAAQLVTSWAALFAVAVSAFIYGPAQWATITGITLLLATYISGTYRLVKANFLAWEDVDSLLNQGILTTSFVDEKRIVREMQVELL